MKQTIFTLLLLASLQLSAGEEKMHITERGSLQNCRIKFEQEKKGRVAFLGGSITEMTGWRDMICEELQRRFPDTEFDFINAGISSTGTTPGAFRFKRDVLCNGPVDLLFEEAAVNDETNKFSDQEQIRGMEGIIRQALLSNRNTDIIMLHFIWDEMLLPLEQGIIPQVILNHEKVAAYYQIPSINLALEVSQRMQAGEFDWKTFGGTHPAPFGHKIYAATICRLFDKMWNEDAPCTPETPAGVDVSAGVDASANDDTFAGVDASSGDDASTGVDASAGVGASADPGKRRKISPHVIPEKSLDAFSYFNGELADIQNAILGKGWKYEADWQPVIKAGTRKRFVHVPAIETRVAGAQLRFSFKGKAIGIFHVAGPDAGIIEYSIDGKPFRQKDLFTEWSSRLYIPWVTMLEQELEEGEHEIIIRMAKEHNTASEGTACQIFYFTVNK